MQSQRHRVCFTLPYTIFRRRSFDAASPPPVSGSCKNKANSASYIASESARETHHTFAQSELNVSKSLSRKDEKTSAKGGGFLLLIVLAAQYVPGAARQTADAAHTFALFVFLKLTCRIWRALHRTPSSFSQQARPLWEHRGCCRWSLRCTGNRRPERRPLW